MAEEMVRAPEALGARNRSPFQEEALAALDLLGEDTGGTLAIDLSSTRAIDSMGLSALVLIQLRAAERRHSVVLRGASEEVRFLLLMTGLEDRFRIENGPEATPAS